VSGRDGVLGKEFKTKEVVILQKQDMKDMSRAGSISWRSPRDKQVSKILGLARLMEKQSTCGCHMTRCKYEGAVLQAIARNVIWR